MGISCDLFCVHVDMIQTLFVRPNPNTLFIGAQGKYIVLAKRRIGGVEVFESLGTWTVPVQTTTFCANP